MPDIVVTSVDGIATVRLDRPDRANAVTPDVTDALHGTISELGESAGVRAIVLTGTGKAFCAGADVKEQWDLYTTHGMPYLIDYLTETWMPSVQKAIRALRRVPKPVVAAVNGAAAAGGFDFALACDVRIAVPNARFTESYMNLGMVPVGGGAHLLTQTVGRSLALELVATGRVMDADEALSVGIVRELVAADELHIRAASFAGHLADAPATTTQAAKELVAAGDDSIWESALVRSYEANCRLLGHPEVQARLTRILETFGKRDIG